MKNGQKIKNKLKMNIHIKTIRGRLILSQVCVLLILTALLSGSIYTFICEILKNENREAYERILDASEVILNDSLVYYTDVARIILENNTVRSELQKGQEKSGNGIFMDVDEFTNLEAELQSYANGVQGISSLYLFDKEGKLFYIDPNSRSMDVIDRVNFEDIKKSLWYKKALNAKGKEVYYGYDVLKGNDSNFSCVKVLNNLNTSDRIGVLILNIQKDVLENVFQSVSKEQDVYAILYNENEKQHLVYQNGYDQTIYKQSLEKMMENIESEYEISSHPCEIEGWELVHVIDKNEIIHEAGQIRTLIIILGSAAILFMVLLTIRQAYQITRPLYQLKESIQRVGMGERHFDNEFQDDEVGVIGQEFQSMVKEKIELNEKIAEEELRRRESELELLQSQINPHFLYNTLDTLYWMAIGEEKENIAQLTQALSDIFRISLNSGKELITIREELKFIEDYLYIQNIRFEDKFITQIKVEEELYEWKIIKLILEPFIENAIYHGLESKMDQGRLNLSGRIEGEFLVFIIEDNGVGMDTSTDITKGYAIQNIIERIKLHYTDAAEVLFESEKGKGTRVKICLPLEEVKHVGSRAD